MVNCKRFLLFIMLSHISLFSDRSLWAWAHDEEMLDKLRMSVSTKKRGCEIEGTSSKGVAYLSADYGAFFLRFIRP